MTTSVYAVVFAVLYGILASENALGTWMITAGVTLFTAASLLCMFSVCDRVKRMGKGTGSNRPRGVSVSLHGRKRLRLAVVFLLCAGAVLYGALRADAQPRYLTDGWLGTSVQVQGQVTAVYPNSRGAAVYLNVHQIVRDGRKLPCTIRVRWNTSKTTTNLTAGREVRLTGVLGRPSAKLPASTPVRLTVTRLSQSPDHTQETASKSTSIPLQAPTYTLTGHLLGVRTTGQGFWISLRSRWLATGTHTSGVTTDHQKLAASIVFGADDGLSGSVKQAFLGAGLLHVLAASGANILLLEVTLEHTLYPLWRRVRLPFWGWSLMLIAFIWAFAGMCGFQPSIIRAALMSSYRLLGFAVGRKASVSMSLAVAAALLTLSQPYTMLSPSAWLSFVATAAMTQQLFASRREVGDGVRDASLPDGAVSGVSATDQAVRRVSRFVKHRARSVVTIVTTTVRVEVFAAPLVLALFGQVTPYSIVANVICEPLIGLLLPCSIAWLALSSAGLLVPALGVLAAGAGFVEDHLIGLLTSIVTTVSVWPGALWTITGLPVWWIVLYYLLLTVGRYFLFEWHKLRPYVNVR